MRFQFPTLKVNGMRTSATLTPTPPRTKARATARALLTAGGLLCGLLAGASLVSAQSADPKSLVPEQYKKAGEIHFAANAAYPPFNFKSETGESSGLEVALLNAVGERLGVKMKFTPSDFATVLPGVTAGRFDGGAAGFWNTEERRKVVEFINYMYAVDGLVVMKGNPAGITIGDLCGKTISGSQGSYQANNLKALSDKCVADGKAPIEVLLFQGTPNQIVALKSGRVQASNIDKAVGAYLSKKDGGSIEPLPGVMPNAAGNKFLMGFLVKKGETDLAKAIQAGMNSIIKDGTYAKILKEWDIADEGRLPESTIN
jgi:polar amino acid transport system substrate-binding protein